jgi:nucleoid DNA-binding protein
MEELIKMVTQKVGISESQAKSAVETVVSFLKDKMPAGIGSQVESFVKGNTGSIGNVVDGLKDKIGF